jgi:anti-sigma B factor antagonist
MKVESGGNWARVSLCGEIDMQWLETHQEQIERLCDARFAHVVLDMDAVTFMDSSGMGLIARLCHYCKDQEGFVYILRPSETILKAMDSVGLTQVSQVVIADTTPKVAHVDQHFATADVG